MLSAILKARAERAANQEALREQEAQRGSLAERRGEALVLKERSQRELIRRPTTFAARFKRAVHVPDRRAGRLERDAETSNQRYQALSGQVSTVDREISGLRAQQADIPNPREQLAAHYEKAASKPLSQEEKQEALKPEILAGLSEEQYIALWKRLNPFFLTHVTRQGFRDHRQSMGFLHAGGQETFHRGFTSAMIDGQALRPAIALRGLRSRDPATVQQFLEQSGALAVDNRQKALERLNLLLYSSVSDIPAYADITAVHFSAQRVNDANYGGETGNEVFFVYPTDFLASQYPFAFNDAADFAWQTEDRRNDICIWPPAVEDLQIAVNAGFVFLPKSTPVDPETGSVYASEVKLEGDRQVRVMVEDSDKVAVFQQWWRQDHRGLHGEERRELAKTFSGELEELGFSEEATQQMAHACIDAVHWDAATIDQRLVAELKKAGVYWKRATETVSAQTYWETYFRDHPEQHPAHVHYYDGEPTAAVFSFLQKHGIGRADTSKTTGPLLGFDKNHVEDKENDPRANAGLSELESTAKKIINEHYGATANHP